MTGDNVTAAPVTQAEFARRVGVKRQVVGRNLAHRVPADCLGVRDGKTVIVDVEGAVKAWHDSADRSRAPGYVKERLGGDLARASASEKLWRSRLAELEFLKRSGELVNAKAMTAKLVDVYTRCRTRLLGLPTRIRQAVPHLSTKDVGLVDTLVRETLEELAADLQAPAKAAGKRATGG